MTDKPEPQIEPVWYLQSLAPSAYSQTRHWKKRREEYRNSRLQICELCRLGDDGEDWVKFHVHHISYARRGYERDEDLRLLCAPCHHLVHFPDHFQSQHWLEVRSFACPDLEAKALELRPPELDARDDQTTLVFIEHLLKGA